MKTLKAKLILNLTGCIIVTIDKNHKVTFINKEGCKLLEYDKKEVIGKNWLENFVPERIREDIEKVYENLIAGKIEKVEYENPILTKSGKEKIIAWHNKVLKNEVGKTIGTLNSGIDITEQKKSRRRTVRSFKKAENMLESISDAILLISLNGRIKEVNREFERNSGWGKEEIIGKTYVQLGLISKEETQRVEKELIPKLMREGSVQNFEMVGKRKDGTKFSILLSCLLIKDATGKPTGILTIAKDITEQKKIEKKLKESERKFHLMVSQIKDYAVFMLDPNGIISSWNEGARHIKGYTQKEIIGQHFSCFYTKEDREKGKPEKELEIAAIKGHFEAEEWRVRKDASRFYAHIIITPLKDKNDKLIGFTKVTQDITKQMKTEQKIKRLYFLQTAIREINQVLLRVKSETELFQRVCKPLIEIENFRFAWIGLLQKETFEVKPVAYAEFEEGCCLSFIKLRRDDPNYGKRPTVIAIKTGKPFIINDIENDSRYIPWRKEILKIGCKSSIALPLSYNSQIIGALTIYSWKKDNFQDEIVKFLKEVANDIAVGIRSLRLEEELKKSVEDLGKTTEEIIDIIAKIGETRDPYTSGHQKRVANLAYAIAKEMGLSKDKIKGIYMAGIIHDIGKIYVPAEILSKPGKLTKLELQMVKTHPEYGYNMLKKANLPWPVAQTILQHHERLDGSGYPQGLLKKNIILEARILAVADVVEAMSSHRPYRPALGIDKALDEISQNKG